ncbi:hypothetical protein [Tistrella sp.]|uniref:hypothetical protein n=1 Tax=Tistrella sp. TaxID=2024861 RepID=UPI0025E7472B|nr:hypothetical protein [Tistrella sp.]|tara:strand:+ start:3278 stop:3616 length:339 start_codon:yes stop_codon:yes gene_type:complete
MPKNHRLETRQVVQHGHPGVECRIIKVHPPVPRGKDPSSDNVVEQACTCLYGAYLEEQFARDLNMDPRHLNMLRMGTRKLTPAQAAAMTDLLERRRRQIDAVLLDFAALIRP